VSATGYLDANEIRGSNGSNDFALTPDYQDPTPTPPYLDPTPTTTPDVCPPLGEVTGDGIIDIIDALRVAQFYVGVSVSVPRLCAADVNCDDDIDIIDALLIAQYYVGIISGF
jgi:hypothetical protein